MFKTCSYRFQICSAINQQQNEIVKKTNDFLGRFAIVVDLESDQIDNITKIPGMIE